MRHWLRIGGLIFVALLGAALWGFGPGTSQTRQSTETIMQCGEFNEKILRAALETVFGDVVEADAVEDLICVKTAFSSDLFALGIVSPKADLSALDFASADDWQNRRLAAARRNFPQQMPPQDGGLVKVVSGFSNGGAHVVVIADYGELGRFVYFELL